MALNAEQKRALVELLEDMGVEQVTQALPHGKFNPSVESDVLEWLAEQDREMEHRREVSHAEPMEIARLATLAAERAAIAAERASAAAERQAIAAERANSRATIALAIATVSIVATAIGIWITHSDVRRTGSAVLQEIGRVGR